MPAPTQRGPRNRPSGFGRYPLEYAVLGLLMTGPKHGYRLHQEFEHTFRLIWKAGQTKLYMVLTNLAEQGYVQAYDQPQDKAPDRKVYSISESGRQALLDWLYEPVHSLRAVRVEFIARLRLIGLIGLPDGEELIAAQKDAIQQMLEEWQHSENGDPFIDRVVNTYRVSQARSIIEWLDSLDPAALQHHHH